MPTVGLYHTKYWEFSDTTVAPVHIGRGGYPIWQASVIAPSLLGMIGAWLDTRLAQWRWWRAIYRRVTALDHERRQVLLHTLDALEWPAYTAAQTAVRQTAVTLGFNRPDAWTELSREMKHTAANAENTYRHLLACRKVKTTMQAQGSTLTNPQLHLVTELAYDGFSRVS